MALKLEAHYPNRFDSPSTEYPQGKWRNRSDSTANDGGYLEQDWLNDEYGFRGALLVNGGVTPDGTIDTAQRSQVYEALINVITANQQDTSGFLLKANLSSATGQRTDTAMTQKAVTDALDGKRDLNDGRFNGNVTIDGGDYSSLILRSGSKGYVQIERTPTQGLSFIHRTPSDSNVHVITLPLDTRTGTIALLDDSSKLGGEQTVNGDSSTDTGTRLFTALSKVPPNSVVVGVTFQSGTSYITAHYRPITRV